MNSAAVQSLSLRDVSLLREQAFINGRWEPARDGRTITVVNPATGGVLTACRVAQRAFVIESQRPNPVGQTQQGES